ncbi:MAG TPA: HlyD family efflux transporter periplasmic adaptor subunit [Bacteroidales bacterium]|nr:HlyD family efflux transporter periplasmic adaptor subunit [Bacteroidales bacterium]HRZ20658.1 HlyD family efflux transporter periplasmic adaptor subunit [Bacteroidales bacterium]
MPEQEESHNVELHSNEIEDVLGRPPAGIIRWGISIIFIILTILVLGSFFFRYPEIITAAIEVTSENPPAYIESRVNGKLDKLPVGDKQAVDSGAIVAIIENPASYPDVFALKESLSRLAPSIYRHDVQVMDSVRGMQNLRLGEIQPSYTDFLVSLEDYLHFMNLNYFARKVASCREELLIYDELVHRLEEQEKILEQDLALKKKDLDRYQQLFENNVITESDMERAKSEYLQKELSFEESREELASARIQISRLEQNILDLGLQDVQQLKKLQVRINETYENLLAQIDIWEKQYTLKAPFDGLVTYTQYWNENQNVNQGDKVMAIVPQKESQMIGQLKLRPRGAGKVKVGQDVNVKFLNYPYMEFGMVRGRVNKISPVPSGDEYYLVEVTFPEGLRTNYGFSLEVIQQMTGQAEIITEEIPLLVRIIMPVRSLIKNRSFRSLPENPGN